MGRKKIPRYAPRTALELDQSTMRKMGERALSRVLDHLRTLPKQPLHSVAGGKKLAASLREPLPERGVPFERLMKLLFGRVIPTSLNTASAGYLAYVPGGGLFQAALADFIALSTNRFSSVWVGAPGLAQLEENVVQWFCGELGLPPGSGGLLTSGGSMANLIALVTARRERLPPNFLSGVIYTSSQAHHSVAKAAVFAGFPPERVRSVPVDERFRVDLTALERAIEEDRRAGLTPFCAVGHAGTTNTGAVDALDRLADLAERERLWLHVDGAYGGFFAMTRRGKAALCGIERADSVTLDPHKGMFLPYGTGCLVVKDRSALRRAHSMAASYMPPMQTEDELVDFAELGPELSREARGLRVWLPLKLHGAEVFRDALDEKLDLAQRAADQLRALPHVELVAPPALSLFAFRVRPPGLRDERELEALNRAVLGSVNDRQRVFLTGATVEGRFLIRVCVLSFRTHREHLDACLDDLRAAISEAVEAGPA